jgi:(p)ppGpp synthase/HD superfamily hydrolase
MATLEKAIEIAARVHAGAVDKAGEPYIFHPLRIMMRMSSMEAKIVAVLHDVVEDSSETIDSLRQEGFSEEILAALDGVTDRKHLGESYEDFVERASKNPISREVKIGDLEDNMNMLRLDKVEKKQMDRLEKYHRSWLKLKALDNAE